MRRPARRRPVGVARRTNEADTQIVHLSPPPESETNARPPGRMRVGDTRRTMAWASGVAALIFAGNLFQDRYLFWDSYLDLAAGRVIAHDGIPHHEVFTVAAHGDRWIDQQWLAHLLTYASWSVGGYPGVAILSSAAVAAAFGLLSAMLISRGVHPQRAVLWAIGAYAVCLGNTVIRAQALAYPLFVLLLWGLLDDADRPKFRRRNLLVLPLLVVWANLHGSALLAAMLVTIASSIRAVIVHRRGVSVGGYALIALVAPLSVFATPYGFSVVHYYTALIGNPVVSKYILEWAPPSFGNPFSFAFIVLLVVTAGAMGYAGAKGRRPGAVPLALLILTTLVAAQAVRYAAWFGFTASAVNAETLAGTGRSPHSLAPRVLRMLATLIAVFAVFSLIVLVRTPDAQFERLQPRAAMQAAATYAASHPDARVLADDTSSSAILWKYPSLEGRVAFDARLEQFSRAQLEQWFRYMTVSGRDWQAATRGYSVLVVSRRDHAELANAVTALPGWHVLEDDRQGITLVRD
jgi:hypothetical protein